MQKITAIIPCYNEEIHLAAVIESVRWADEILVVDSFSTDDSLAIARAAGVRILQREYENSASQKNWAIPQATHDWIVLVDADERVTPELRDEIQATLEAPTCDAYWVRRQNYFMGQRVRYSGLQGDKVIRLFRKSCRYEPLHVHAEVDTRGLKVGMLRGVLTHDTFKSVDDYLYKIKRYARWQALDYDKRTPRVTGFHLWVKPAFRFFKHYILKRGILDGHVGFIISAVNAWAVFLRYWKLLELRWERARTLQ